MLLNLRLVVGHNGRIMGMPQREEVLETGPDNTRRATLRRDAVDELSLAGTASTIKGLFLYHLILSLIKTLDWHVQSQRTTLTRWHEQIGILRETSSEWHCSRKLAKGKTVTGNIFEVLLAGKQGTVCPCVRAGERRTKHTTQIGNDLPQAGTVTL